MGSVIRGSVSGHFESERSESYGSATSSSAGLHEGSFYYYIRVILLPYKGHSTTI